MKLTNVLAMLTAAVAVGLYEAAPAGADETTADSAVEISPNADRPAGPGPAETFTGDVSVKPLFDATGIRTFGSAEVSFNPSARTAWHTHPAGQTLIVTAGSGWVQQWDGVRQAINPGDVIWTPPGVRHWHGATETDAMTHIAIQGTLDGTAVEWMEHVTDAEYRG